MTYLENPKTKGSGIVCAIPQTGTCPVGCADCFFQSGRSYLEPLADNLPNLPKHVDAADRIVRMNDGNDSNVERAQVERAASVYADAFFNTSMPTRLDEYPGPVVLTANPGKHTDARAHLVMPPPNLMFVRARVNTWNLENVDRIVVHYTTLEVPVVLTFMAYYDETIPDGHTDSYVYRKRTLNSYWVITPAAWDAVVARYASNKWVYTCGKDADTHACSRCGNCLREYYATRERMRVS